MEDELSGDLLGNVLRPPSLRGTRSLRPSRGASSPQGSPSFKRQHSATVRTPTRKDAESRLLQPLFWLRRCFNRRLPWVFLIGLWLFLVFKVYSRGPGAIEDEISEDGQDLRRHISLRGAFSRNAVNSGLSRLARDWIWHGYLKNNASSSRSAAQKPPPSPGGVVKLTEEQSRRHEYVENASDINFWRFQALQAGDFFLGKVVGPYDELERKFLSKPTEKNAGSRSCSSDEGRFREFVRGKRIVVLMHELSMTGSPLAMMELATEVLACGGKVSVVVLDRRGGLLNELIQRRIPVLADKTAKSWRVAAKADLVVSGSAVCASWIGDYLKYNKKGSSKVVWWIMENRRLYFDRSKRLLGKVRALVFLSKIQAEQWQDWASKEKISLPSRSSIVSLSVNDAVLSAANETATLAKIRDSVRKDIGLQERDFLLATLSSINPGKGQLLALYAAAEVIERKMLQNNSTTRSELKLLIGSVGSKSNKMEYVEKMLNFLHQHPTLAESVLWTPASVSVSALYAAADAYLMNAQGIGETFGRVTVEAMAFGLPILGTDAGGTKEIVDANATGFLHPAGAKGATTLSENILALLRDPDLGKQMGNRGRIKVGELYTQAAMYEKLAQVFTNLR